jgi:5-methylcytosine-specific restriction endonuclease McrA
MRNDSVSTEHPTTAAPIVTCRVCGAPKETKDKYSLGLCQKHYRTEYARKQRRAAGVPERGPKKTEEELKRRKSEYYQQNKQAWTAYYDANRDAINAARRARKQLMSPEQRSAEGRKIYEKYKEKILASNKASNERNKDKINARRAEYRRVNKEAIRQRVKEARAAGKHQAIDKSANARRRAQEKATGGRVRAADVRELMVLQRYRCATCRCDIRKKYDVDHITPISRGGSSHKLNLQLLCFRCNNTKSNKHPIEFMQSLGFLL